MSYTDEHRDERHEHAPDDHVDWSRLGKAAEEFARHVARDAGRFAERIEGHARDLARDVGREWRRAERRHHRHAGDEEHSSSEETRRVFDDVRSLIGDVLDGVDELIARIFPSPADSPPETPRTPEPPQPPGSDLAWTRVVANRSAICAVCGLPIAAGAEVSVRLTGGEPEFRCSACGDLD